MLRSSVLLLTTRDFINEVFKGHFQGCDFCHGLISKAAVLLFKQSYDNLRSSRREPAASAGTAQSGRCCYRKQSAVCASHNVPSDTIPQAQLLIFLTSVLKGILHISQPKGIKGTEKQYLSIRQFPVRPSPVQMIHVHRGLIKAASPRQLQFLHRLMIQVLHLRIIYSSLFPQENIPALTQNQTSGSRHVFPRSIIVIG